MLELLALTGVVILVSAIASGPFERAGVSLVLLFLIIGFLVGPLALGLADFAIDSPQLQLVATISLTMVLFSDAVSVSPSQIRAQAGLATLILGPGTLTVAFIIAFAAWKLLEFSVPGSAMLGAALASTDMVLLRSVLRNPRVPEPVRQALRLESGMNDAVLLPIVLIALAVATTGSTQAADYLGIIGRLLIAAPLAGAVIGLICVFALDVVRSRYGMRRDYESLYAVGVALTAFAVGEALHTSGYLAAFTAGLAIAFRDVELCDCFHDYGEATAEAALLLTFVALGSSAMWLGMADIDAMQVLFVLIALAARPIVLSLVLLGRGMSKRDLALIAWFGPRGLNSLLLILVPVFAGMAEGRELFAVCSLVVVASVVLHGASPALLSSKARHAEGVEVSDDEIRISMGRVQEIIAEGENLNILDVRTEGSFHKDPRMPEHAVRVNPNHAVKEVMRLGLPRDAWLASYCT